MILRNIINELFLFYAFEELLVCVSCDEQVSAMVESPMFGMDAFNSISKTDKITRRVHRIKLCFLW